MTVNILAHGEKTFAARQYFSEDAPLLQKVLHGRWSRSAAKSKKYLYHSSVSRLLERIFSAKAQANVSFLDVRFEMICSFIAASPEFCVCMFYERLDAMTLQTDKLLFTAPKKNCHCEPARTLVWQSPDNSGLFVRAFVRFWYISPLSGGLPRQCAHWLAMTAFFRAHL